MLNTNVNPVYADRCRKCNDRVLLGFYDGARSPEWRHTLSQFDADHDAEPDSLTIRAVWERYERGER